MDKLGIGKVLPIAILIVTAGAFLLANANSYEMVILSQVVLAIGASFGFVGAGYVGGAWFGFAKFGFMFGLVQTVASLGSLFGGEALNYAVTVFDWRSIINYIGAFGIILVIISFFYLKDREPVVSPKGEDNFFKSVIHKLVEVGKKPQIWFSALMGAVLFGSLLSLAVVWGTKIIQANGIEKITADKLASLIWLGLAFGAAFANKFSNYLKSRRKAIIFYAISFLITFVAFLYMPLSETSAAIIMFILGFLNGGHMLSFTMAGELVSGDKVGTASAITNGIMFLTGGIFISVPGDLLKNGVNTTASFQHAMLPVLITIAVIIIVNIIFLKETYKTTE